MPPPSCSLAATAEASSEYDRYDPESRVKTDFGNTSCLAECIGGGVRGGGEFPCVRVSSRAVSKDSRVPVEKILAARFM